MDNLKKVIYSVGILVAASIYMRAFALNTPVEKITSIDQIACEFEYSNLPHTDLPYDRPPLSGKTLSLLKDLAGDYVILDEFSIQVNRTGSIDQALKGKTVEVDGREFWRTHDPEAIFSCPVNYSSTNAGVDTYSFPHPDHPVQNAKDAKLVISVPTSKYGAAQPLPTGVLINPISGAEFGTIYSGLFQLEEKQVDAYDFVHVFLKPIGNSAPESLKGRLVCSQLVKKYGWIGRVVCPLATLGTVFRI